MCLLLQANKVETAVVIKNTRQNVLLWQTAHDFPGASRKSRKMELYKIKAALCN